VTEIPPTKFAKLGDDRIAYQVIGDGPPDLLWVPGIGDALDIRWEYPPFASFMWRLASFSRLIMLDRRGMGASDPLPLDALPRWEEFADDALAVLDAVGSEPTVLLGANDAGPTAILFAATRPERTHSLILFDSVVGSQPGTPIDMFEEELEARNAILAENWGTEEGVTGVPDLADDPVLVRFHAKNMRMSCSPRQAAAYMRQNRSIDLSHVLSSVRVPTLLLHRQEPHFIPIDTSRYLAAHIPGAEVVVVPGKGLNIYTKPYAQILDQIEAFVTGTSPASDTNRALATILFTDIVGSTDKAASVGDRRWRGLLESHDAIANSIVEQHGGRLVKLTGTGCWPPSTVPGGPSAVHQPSERPSHHWGSGSGRDCTRVRSSFEATTSAGSPSISQLECWSRPDPGSCSRRPPSRCWSPGPGSSSRTAASTN
jgi:pimeloyl-ACP methyl ester carboxylesterase